MPQDFQQEMQEFNEQIRKDNEKGKVVVDFTVQGHVLYQQIKQQLQEHFHVDVRFRDTKLGCYEAYFHIDQTHFGEAVSYLISLFRQHRQQNEGDPFIHNKFNVSVYW